MQRCSFHQLKRGRVDANLININRLIQLSILPSFDLYRPIRSSISDDVLMTDFIMQKKEEEIKGLLRSPHLESCCLLQERAMHPGRSHKECLVFTEQVRERQHKKEHKKAL